MTWIYFWIILSICQKLQRLTKIMSTLLKITRKKITLWLPPFMACEISLPLLIRQDYIVKTSIHPQHKLRCDLGRRTMSNGKSTNNHKMRHYNLSLVSFLTPRPTPTRTTPFRDTIPIMIIIVEPCFRKVGGVISYGHSECQWTNYKLSLPTAATTYKEISCQLSLITNVRNKNFWIRNGR